MGGAAQEATATPAEAGAVAADPAMNELEARLNNLRRG